MDAKQPDLTGLSVLVVEDEAFIAFALKSYLEEAGAVSVTTASTLKEADIKITNGEFGAAIVDVRLPDGEAYELAAKLIDQGVPVVIHSGHATQERHGELAGAVFCAKPATPNELLAALGEARSRTV